MSIHAENLLTGFGFQVALEHLNLANVWYTLHDTISSKFYVFDKKKVQGKISERFLEISNSDALVVMANSLDVIDESLKTDNYLIYQTNRPHMNFHELNASEILDKLREITATDFSYEFSQFESGSWRQTPTLTILLPSDVRFQAGSTTHVYDNYDFNILKSKLDFRGEGPERLTLIDGHFSPLVKLIDVTLPFNIQLVELDHSHDDHNHSAVGPS